jgi:hypothetical protein
VASDNAHPAGRQPGPAASDNRTPAGPRRRGLALAPLPPPLDAVNAGTDGDPLTDPAAGDGAVRDYRTWLQTVAGRKPATINAILTALADFCTRTGWGRPPPGASTCPSAPPRPRRQRHHPLAADR